MEAKAFLSLATTIENDNLEFDTVSRDIKEQDIADQGNLSIAELKTMKASLNTECIAPGPD